MYRLSSIILVLFGFTQLFAQKSPHGKTLEIDCAKCHTTSESWKMDFKTLKFDHANTAFVLEGTHIQTDCIECHKTLVFDEAQTDCMSCHTDIHSASVGNDCIRCHTPEAWTVDNIPELHEQNGFPLTDAHNNLACIECHTTETELIFERIGNDCINCHNDDFNNATDPNHVLSNFSMDCTECHSTFLSAWTPSTFNHEFFPLTQGHDINDCKQCHITNNFDDASDDCISCHQTDFDATTNPNHLNAGFDTDCITCHTTVPDWTPATFDHDFFPLTQSHDLPDCTTCHDTANFSDQIADCVSCHQTDFDATTNPNHLNAGFDTDCITCHTTTPDWTPSTFDHDFFPLTQGHDLPDCTTCHDTSNFSDQIADCVSCHQTDFDSAINPNHIDAGFPTDCITCHTTTPDWTPSTFNHDFFPLTQGHDLPNCTTCHDTANFSDQIADCVSCHQTDFDATSNPNHIGAGFNTDCIACHTAGGWTPSSFDHSLFPLTLGHDIQDCNTCHTTPVYADQSPDCVSCHQTDFDATTNPNHIDAGFPTDCIVCHTTNPDWTPATFDHGSFPLTLGHDLLDCTQCHVTVSFSDASPDCVSCHQADFDSTTNPNHTDAGFPTDCITCHTTAPDWTPATFDHDNFPLTLGHDIQDCNVCHTTPNFSDASADCISCHQTDYDGAIDPNHIDAGFPTDCVVCHTTNPDWSPANFDHDGQYFPIYSGKHQGEWNTCNECHTTAGNYALFSCIDCHEHNDQIKLADKHKDESGYVFESTACFECHPNGDE